MDYPVEPGNDERQSIEFVINLKGGPLGRFF